MQKLNFLIILCCILVISQSAEASAGHGSNQKDSNQFPPMRSSSKTLYVEQPWSTRNQRGDPSGGVSAKCTKLLDTFTNTTGTYLKCILTNARPQHYCENCVGEFTSAVNAYNDICTDDENGTTCRDQLLRADNVQVVLLAYDFVESIWDKSDCHNCYYNATTKNDTIIYKPTKETLEMLKKIQRVQDCFHDFGVDPMANVSVCVVCSDFYVDANVYYNKLDDDGKLCSDIEDSMNYTRRMWSKDFKCDIGVRTDAIIYSIAVAVGLLPVLFYLGTFFSGERESRRRLPSRGEDGGTEQREPINLVLDDTPQEI